MTTLVMLAVLIFGFMGYRRLPVSNLPNVDFPTIQVSASLPGASPETMAAAVATPLEKQFSTIAGLSSMSSASSLGSSQITLQFELDRDLDAAAQDVQAAISKVQRQLPAEMPTPPSYQKVNPADQPILYLALTSASLPLSTLNEYGETLLAQRISMVSGVAQVMVYGSQKYAVRIRLDPNALATRGIGIDEVSQAIQSANVELPTGTLYGEHRAYTIEAQGQVTRAASYRPLIVAYRNGSPVRLEELGTAIDSVENDKVAAWYIDQRAIVLAVQRQPGTNTVQVADAIKAILPGFKSQLPASVSLHMLYDLSESIRESVDDVKFTLVLTLFLVVFVIFLFLRNLSATLIPSLAIPLSVVGTFAAMYLLGYSLDNLSLMALTLSVGFVVDDAIVMLENIVRHLEKGEPVFRAAVNGAREIGFTIVSMTISLAAVFIPVVFMGGIIGRLFHEFAVTIGVAVLLSGVISLSLTPMLCSRILRPGANERHGRLYAFSERGFQAMLRFYRNSLRWVLVHHRLTMIALGVVLVATVYLFVKIPKGFLPTEDTGQIFIQTEGVEGISFRSMVEHQQAVAAVIKQYPGIEAFMSNAGRRGSNAGTVMARLKPRSERERSADEIIEELRSRLAQIPGIRAFPQNPPPIRIGGMQTKSQYQFTLQDPDTDELYRYAGIMLDKIQKLEGLVDVNSDLQIKNPQVNVAIDRDKASSLGISVEQIEDSLYNAYGSRQISTIYAPNNTYQVILEVKPEYQLDPNALSMLYLRSSSGRLVPLNAVATLTRGVGPLTVNHLGQLPAVTISFNLQPGYALGDAVKAIDAIQRQVLPATVSTSFQGAAQAFQSSVEGLGLLLVMAILVIYIVLGILYESFIHPLTILSALPMAGFGALLTLLVFRVDLNIYAFVGVIMLVGLVKKNGIMMIDFALEAQRKEGRSPEEAIYEACIIRFRPIMMTTMSALMAAIPIAVGFGAGGESRRPLGLAVVGGLLFSQFLTLYVTPVFYTYMDAFQEKIRRRLQKGRLAAPAPV